MLHTSRYYGCPNDPEIRVIFVKWKARSGLHEVTHCKEKEKFASNVANYMALNLLFGDHTHITDIFYHEYEERSLRNYY